MNLDNIILTSDQNNALDRFYQFLGDPSETVFVLEGYSGCGKSTLVSIMLDRIPGYMKTLRLIDPSTKELPVVLTATTNKAAENLAHITGQEVRTIHSYLGLRVDQNFQTGITKLVPRNATIQTDTIVFIDEASKVDRDLLALIFKRTSHCKIVFVGDPAQLVQFGTTSAPVFSAKFPGAALTQVVRQPKPEGGLEEVHPITALATQFRDTVNGGDWPTFTPDGVHIQHLGREAFLAEAEKEFSRPNWRHADSKMLAWTNKCVIGFNHYLRNLIKGDPDFQVGDYAICNSFIGIGKKTLKTDQMVEITGISGDVEVLGVLGNRFTVDSSAEFFMPKTLASKNLRLREAKTHCDYDAVAQIETTWIDLRAANASTVDKAQGSTHDTVFIDLDDVGKCNASNQLARMLYVAVSRARNRVYLTGDLV